MTDARPVHYAAPHKVTPRGFYVNTACGTYLPLATQPKTTDPAQVTCRSCRQTRVVADLLDADTTGTST